MGKILQDGDGDRADDELIVIEEQPASGGGRDLDLLAAFRRRYGPVVGGEPLDSTVLHEADCPANVPTGLCSCRVEIQMTLPTVGRRVVLRWKDPTTP